MNQETQANAQTNGLTADETAASLAFATHHMGQGLQASQPQNPAPQQAQPQEPQKDPLTEMQDLQGQIMSELQTIKEDMKALQPKDEKNQINDLKKQIEDVLNAD